MSDETSNVHDGNKGWNSEPAMATGAETPKAFCQDCGKPLTPETLRTVGAGVFCEPCLAARVGVPVGATSTAIPPVPGEPHPMLALLLGFIPGVGAMYNGQYAKGFAHLIIFMLLASLSDHVNGVFGFFCFLWVCYMAFDAYHTAKARLEGLPLPNPFGLNEIGERMGFGTTWKVGVHTPSGTTPPPYSPPTYAPPPPYNAPPTAGPDWVGYVPPTEFGAAAAYKPTQTVPQTSYGAPTYTGAPASEHTVPYVAPVVPPVPARRFPVGAFWLIGLGALILLATVMPEEWSINGRWFPPVIFTALAVLILQRRLRRGRRVICYLRWPVIFLILAVMTGLHAAYFAVTFGLTCAVILIALGALLLLERTVGAAPMYVATPPVSDATRASFTSAGAARTETIADNDSEKDGQ